MTCKSEIEEWLALRKREALKIDPETAEVTWWHAPCMDPYRLEPEPDLPEEGHQVSRAYFARSPGGKVWVWFGGVPDEIRLELWERLKSTLAFPAGPLDFNLEFLDDFAKNDEG